MDMNSVKRYLLCLGVLLLVMTLAAGCNGRDDTLMAKDGDTVKVHYTGTLEDGTVFDSSREREPLEFTIGAGKVIKGFDDAAKGMQVGETKTVNIAAEDAYGQHRQDLVFTVPIAQIATGVVPEVGQTLELHDTNGKSIPVVVIEVNETEIKVDANFKLAGKDLIFEIELVEIA